MARTHAIKSVKSIASSAQFHFVWGANFLIKIKGFMEYTGATQRSRHFVPPPHSPPGGPVFQAPRRKGRLSDRTLIEEIQSNRFISTIRVACIRPCCATNYEWDALPNDMG